MQKQGTFPIFALVLMMIIITGLFPTLVHSAIPLLSKEDRTEMKAAADLLAESHGHDYSGLYQHLEKNVGKKEKILQICDEFDPIYCLKKASQKNPDMRSEICGRLVEKISVQYKDRMNAEEIETFKENHRKECELGIPQFAR